MISFKPIELSDKAWIDECTRAEDSRSADFNFANMYMWDDCFRQLVAEVEGCFVAKLQYREHPFFSFPVGGGDKKRAMEQLHRCALENGFPFCVSGLTAEHRALMESAFPGKLQFMPGRDYFDYIYLAEKLATLEGKKLHGKRNHINRFLENCGDSWRFVPLTRELLPECGAMLEDWTRAYLENGGTPDGVEDEHRAIGRAFEHFDYLGLEGGALYVGDRMVAFTVGEKISSDTYNVHFEKAHADVQGAYPMINREFVRHVLRLHPEIVYINREDDMGHEGLRKAKLSYDPVFMVEKFEVCLCGIEPLSL